ncbi:MAG: chemotaxis protein CheX [Deltaproteobacteria bacterium]|nr:chemotaxis protein CheX [Deltaproteobacteria bacterium]
MYLGNEIDRVVETSSIELCAAYNVAVSLRSCRISSYTEFTMRGGVIGITGKDLRGSLGLRLTDSILEETDALGHDKNDWIAELTNQFVGRIRNKLLLVGVEIDVGIPITIAGSQFEMSFSNREARIYEFVNTDGIPSVNVYLDGKYDPKMVLNAKDHEAKRPVSEGDLVIF